MKYLYALLRMKRAAALVCLLCAPVLATSCQEDEPPRISLSTETLNFDFRRDMATVEVRSNNPWTAAVQPAEAAAWCTLSLGSSSQPTETLKIYVEDNLPAGTVTEERHATVVFSTACDGSNPTATLHVAQGCKPETNL